MAGVPGRSADGATPILLKYIAALTCGREGKSRSASAAAAALASRIFALSVVAGTLAFVLNDHLIFWRDWPGALPLFAQWTGAARSAGAELSAPGASARARLQAAIYLVPVAAVVLYAFLTSRQPLRVDAARLSALAAYVVRASFWTVLLIGFVDMLISFLRVEDLLAAVVGADLTRELGRSVFRGTYVHLPLMGLAFLIALRTRSLDFVWLAFLVVLAEFQIVISRFVFSYEQAFMGDLVRFWYAVLFLLGSAYALVDEGHVRVDMFYARFSPRIQAWSNLVGSIVLGVATVNQAGAIGAIGAIVMAGYRLRAGTRGAYRPAILAVVSTAGIIAVLSVFDLNIKNIRDERDALQRYDKSLADTVGLRMQRHLSTEEAKEVAGCQASHRDISLDF